MTDRNRYCDTCRVSRRFIDLGRVLICVVCSHQLTRLPTVAELEKRDDERRDRPQA